MFHGLEGLDGTGDLRLDLGDDHHLLEGDPGDTVTLADAGGTTVYADLDGDGVIDHISTVHADGGYDVFTADPHRAAWGLAVADPGSVRADEPAAWGLPPAVTPESGTLPPGKTWENAGWHRIERG